MNVEIIRRGVRMAIAEVPVAYCARSVTGTIYVSDPHHQRQHGNDEDNLPREDGRERRESRKARVNKIELEYRLYNRVEARKQYRMRKSWKGFRYGGSRPPQKPRERFSYESIRTLHAKDHHRDERWTYQSTDHGRNDQMMSAVQTTDIIDNAQLLEIIEQQIDDAALRKEAAEMYAMEISIDCRAYARKNFSRENWRGTYRKGSRPAQKPVYKNRRPESIRFI